MTAGDSFRALPPWKRLALIALAVTLGLAIVGLVQELAARRAEVDLLFAQIEEWRERHAAFERWERDNRRDDGEG